MKLTTRAFFITLVLFINHGSDSLALPLGKRDGHPVDTYSPPVSQSWNQGSAHVSEPPSYSPPPPPQSWEHAAPVVSVEHVQPQYTPAAVHYPSSTLQYIPHSTQPVSYSPPPPHEEQVQDNEHEQEQVEHEPEVEPVHTPTLSVSVDVPMHSPTANVVHLTTSSSSSHPMYTPSVVSSSHEQQPQPQQYSWQGQQQQQQHGWQGQQQQHGQVQQQHGQVQQQYGQVQQHSQYPQQVQQHNRPQNGWHAQAQQQSQHQQPQGACPPQQEFLQILCDNVSSGHIRTNPSISVSFPTGSSTTDKYARMRTIVQTLQNLEGQYSDCKIESAEKFMQQYGGLIDGNIDINVALDEHNAEMDAEDNMNDEVDTDAQVEDGNDIDIEVPDVADNTDVADDADDNSDEDSAVEPNDPTGDVHNAAQKAWMDAFTNEGTLKVELVPEFGEGQISEGCPPDRDTFIKLLSSNAAAGFVLTHPSTLVSFPAGDDNASKKARLQAALDTLTKAADRCPAESTTFVQQMAELGQ